MKKRLATALAALGFLVAATGCGDSTTGAQGIYMLLDTSGTYSVELKKAQQIISAILTKLGPGDSFAVARIDKGSFSEKDIVARVTLDDRPSVANRQKRAFLQQVRRFVRELKPAAYTDITGGVLQATEYLDEKRASRKVIVIYSDLQEELAKGYVRKNLRFRLDGYRVVALNVTKLRTDNVDPRLYMTRLKQWARKVEDGGGDWKVINNLENLAELLPN
jgi:hypothetical protein